uniref:Uncharacterized protein n=1 Tax=Rhizophagus irregularis (strain DAOM 181602 / DAOM 197198 / MUCL 43194) TaxID=747089 RepID=U9TU00_RHIID
MSRIIWFKYGNTQATSLKFQRDIPILEPDAIIDYSFGSTAKTPPLVSVQPDHRSKKNPSSPASQLWQRFEHFVASFRSLKSRSVNDKEMITMSTIHASADLNGDLEYANHHEDTNSEHYIGGNRYIQCVNNLKFPKNSGLVDSSNWLKFFGPYAGRAFAYADVGPLNINTADKRDLAIGINEQILSKVRESSKTLMMHTLRQGYQCLC